jgi:hypothetical protein
MAQWLKAIGGPVGLIVLGVTVLGSVLAFVILPLGLVLIVAGVLLGLNKWDRIPYHVARKDRGAADAERRELLSGAHAVSTELETCRYRLSEAKRDRRGWSSERNLPAEAVNTRWSQSPVAADEIGVTEALRGFYVWADQMNHRMSRRASAEFNAIGSVLRGKSLDLDDDDLVELDEGLSRIKNAQEHLEKLIARLGRP